MTLEIGYYELSSSVAVLRYYRAGGRNANILLNLCYFQSEFKPLLEKKPLCKLQLQTGMQLQYN